MFLKNAWYVFAWAHDVPVARSLTGRVVIGEPVVVWRDKDGALHAMEDRCPHRHAPLSMGRVESDGLRCLYHGMSFGTDGRCNHAPLVEPAPDVRVRTYPVVLQDDWIWIWMGQHDKADPKLVPQAFGLSNPEFPMRAHSIEYAAHYQLIHDNLCDLSHLDFVHADTLRVASGANWAESLPRIVPSERSIRFDRWFENADMPGAVGGKVDAWITYEFVVPGIFILQGARYPAGTAKRFSGKAPVGVTPIIRNFEQQAVTPISATRTAYHYATGLAGSSAEMTNALAKRMDVVMAAFQEDRQMIVAQQTIWDLTPDDVPKHFLPQDKGPFLMRKMLQRLISAEQP